MEAGVTIIPKGSIIIWSGASADIPAGWALCDGTNGTPNLKDKFIIGAGGTYIVDATGGALTHRHTPDGLYFGTTGSDNNDNASEENHLPPYHALCYIMKL